MLPVQTNRIEPTVSKSIECGTLGRRGLSRDQMPVGRERLGQPIPADRAFAQESCRKRREVDDGR